MGGNVWVKIRPLSSKEESAEKALGYIGVFVPGVRAGRAGRRWGDP